jgi:hypothetical protein
MEMNEGDERRPVGLRIIPDRCEADVALSHALLKQTSLLATAIRHLFHADTSPVLGHAELMRLVHSQQWLLRHEGQQRRKCRPTGARSAPSTALNDTGPVFTADRPGA